MAAIFGEGKIFRKLHRLHSLSTLWVENFDEIALSRTVKEIEANLCFAIFGKNSKIQNGGHFGGGENFWKIAKIHSLDTLWVEKDTLRVENFAEIALSRKLVFCHFGQKFENSKWPPFLGRGKFFKNYQECNAQIKFENSKWPPFLGRGKFWKIAKIAFLRYPEGRKFRRNRSISHG